jgi:5-methylcytosine-specific restriction endonuclease McrA
MLWVQEECFRFYVQQRRSHCTCLEIMDLWLRAPYCDACIQDDPFFIDSMPDIDGTDWREDLAMCLGDDWAAELVRAVAKNRDPYFRCKPCHRELRPWEGDAIYVMTYHLEEHFGIPLATPGRRNPSRRVKRKIIELYGRRCFSCGATEELVIDHIVPRSRGGDSAFRNLQPLCSTCGNAKGNAFPSEVMVYSDMYFTDAPSDSFEGMFW